jgi:CheY-like chemotaxis protein
VVSDKIDRYFQLYRGGIESGSTSRAQSQKSSSVQHAVRCMACSQLSESTDAHGYCSDCQSRLRASDGNYSSYLPELVTGHERYFISPPEKTAAYGGERRRHPRIPLRNVRACITTRHGATAVVDVADLSRGGFCFFTSDQWFALGTQVSVAMHYNEGGENISQSGRIVRVRTRSSAPSFEYGVEFSQVSTNAELSCDSDTEYPAGKVLVVDDDRELAYTLGDILKRQGYETAIASSGEEAVYAAGSFRPDCLVSDVSMGKMNGAELAIQILRFLPACKVLLISGHFASQEFLKPAKVQGFEFEVLPKPVPPRELLERISQALQD